VLSASSLGARTRRTPSHYSVPAARNPHPLPRGRPRRRAPLAIHTSPAPGHRGAPHIPARARGFQDDGHRFGRHIEGWWQGPPDTKRVSGLLLRQVNWMGALPARASACHRGRSHIERSRYVGGASCLAAAAARPLAEAQSARDAGSSPSGRRSGAGRDARRRREGADSGAGAPGPRLAPTSWCSCPPGPIPKAPPVSPTRAKMSRLRAVNRSGSSASCTEYPAATSAAHLVSSTTSAMALGPSTATLAATRAATVAASVRARACGL